MPSVSAFSMERGFLIKINVCQSQHQSDFLPDSEFLKGATLGTAALSLGDDTQMWLLKALVQAFCVHFVLISFWFQV